MQVLRRAFIGQSALGLASLQLWSAAARAAAAPPDAGMRAPGYVDVNGIRTRYFEAGSGPPLVLIHGGQFGMDYDAGNWAPIFNGLARHFHVYAFDKLGQGETDDPPSDDHWTMAAVIEHAWGFIEAMGLPEFHLAGHSRGGLPAARIAIDHPDRVRRLIIFNSNTLAPDDPSTPEDFYVKLLAANPPKSPKWPNAKQKLEEVTRRWAAEHPQRVAENPSLANAFAPSPWFIYDLKYETLDLIAAGRLRAPTLIIWGFNDVSAPYKLGVKLVDIVAPQVKPTRFYVLNEAGHEPYVEHPGEVVRLMIDFFTHA
jgi:pimeloyl-ACP methyl ester carboxylesterase